jgi:spore coat polysaccharide biosynthesis protein SpsF
MSSTRLPGKVMRPILGRPMIDLQLERLERCGAIGRLVVATSEEASDDPLAAFLAKRGTPVHRGALADVLDRFHGALQAFGPADIVLRLTADCPLTDPALIDRCVETLQASGADYVSNDLHRTFPRGLDNEVMRASALEDAWREASTPYEREHVTPFIYNNPQRFRLEGVRQGRDESGLRWTVDTPEDFEFARRVYEALYPSNPAFRSEDIRALPFQHYERA